MVLLSFEAFVGYVRTQGRRSRARQPLVRFGSQGEEGLCQGLVFAGSRGETKAGVITPAGF
jgi:hypothetical protein